MAVIPFLYNQRSGVMLALLEQMKLICAQTNFQVMLSPNVC